MPNWFNRRNLFEKNSICEYVSTSRKYYSHWVTGFRKPSKANIEKIIKWAEINTSHDIPTKEELMRIQNK